MVVPSPGDGRPVPRYHGTVYEGGQTEVGHQTTALPWRRDLENTGSLTGHILAQGWPDDTPGSHGTTARVAFALLIGLGVLVTVGLLVLAGVGGVFGAMIGGLLAK